MEFYITTKIFLSSIDRTLLCKRDLFFHAAPHTLIQFDYKLF